MKEIKLTKKEIEVLEWSLRSGFRDDEFGLIGLSPMDKELGFHVNGVVASIVKKGIVKKVYERKNVVWLYKGKNYNQVQDIIK